MSFLARHLKKENLFMLSKKTFHKTFTGTMDKRCTSNVAYVPRYVLEVTIGRGRDVFPASW